MGAAIVTRNKFVGAIQSDAGNLCSNATASGTQWQFSPCSTDTDGTANCTTGNLFNFTETSGDRFVGRCFNPSGTTFDYSGFKMKLDDGVGYSSTPSPSESYRGVDIRGTALVVANALSGGGGSCGSNLLTNGDFEAAAYCMRNPNAGNGSCGLSVCSGTPQLHQNPGSWVLNNTATLITTADCHAGSCVSMPSCGTCGDPRLIGSFSPNLDARALVSCSGGDGCGGGGMNGAATWFSMSKNATYSMAFYAKLKGGSGTRDLSVNLHAANSDAFCSPTYYLSALSSSGAQTATGSWSASPSTATFRDQATDNTYRLYTISFDTLSGLGSVADPFRASVEFAVQLTGTSGPVFYVDDVSICVPGNALDSTALTVRALTEDQLNYTPTTTGAGDSLTLGAFVGADFTPNIAPSIVGGGHITQASLIALRAGVPYTPDADGTFTATTAYSGYFKRPAVGTTRWGTWTAGDVGMDPTDDGTYDYKFGSKIELDPGGDGTVEYNILHDPQGVCSDGEVLKYVTALGGITCRPNFSTGSLSANYLAMGDSSGLLVDSPAYETDENSDGTVDTLNVDSDILPRFDTFYNLGAKDKRFFRVFIGGTIITGDGAFIVNTDDSTTADTPRLAIGTGVDQAPILFRKTDSFGIDMLGDGLDANNDFNVVINGYGDADVYARSFIAASDMQARTFYGHLVGTADMATALAADPSDCSTGQAPTGINASGAAQNCTTYTTGGLASVNLTTQSAAITSTDLYTVTTSGIYRVCYAASVTRAGGVSSVLGGTNGFQIEYTDQDDSASKMTPTTAVTGINKDPTNTTGTAVTGCLVANAKTGTKIHYLMGYTSAGITTMQYNLHIRVEGPLT